MLKKFTKYNNIYLSPYTKSTIELATYMKEKYNIDIKGYIDKSNISICDNIYNPSQISILEIDCILIFSPNWGDEIYENIVNRSHSTKIVILKKDSNDYYKQKNIVELKIFNFISSIFNYIFYKFNIQFETLFSHRIGELSLRSEIFLRNIRNNKLDNNKKYIILIYNNISNKTIYDLYKKEFQLQKNVYIIENKLVLNLLSKIKLDKKNIFIMDQESNELDLFTSTKRVIQFKENDLIKGNKLLSNLGIKKPYVCIFTRDTHYLDQTFINRDGRSQDFRNADIETLNKTIDYLIKKGFCVVRIGSIVEKKSTFQHNMFIDYPYSKYKSDFLDIFLISQCEFIIGTTSGLVDLSVAFQKPRIGINQVPIDHAPFSTTKDMFIPKKLLLNNEYLSLNRYLKLVPQDFHYPWSYFTYKNLNITIENNTDEEILNLVKEFLGDFNLTEEDILNQKRYQKIHLKSFLFATVNTKIGTSFLRKNLWFIEE